MTMQNNNIKTPWELIHDEWMKAKERHTGSFYEWISKAYLAPVKSEVKLSRNIINAPEMQTVDLMSHVTESLVRDLAKKQDDVVFSRLKERVGLDWTENDVIEESKRRFPRLGIFKYPDKTEYVWNDGSPSGILLVTFVDSPPKMETDINKMSIEIKYF